MNVFGNRGLSSIAMRWSLRSLGLAIIAIIGIIMSSLSFGKPKENAVNVKRYDISPDGSLLLVEFVHPKRGLQTALYDWRKEKLTVLQVTVPEAGNGPLVHARFTSDGKSLLALSVLKLGPGDYDAYDAHLVKVDIASQSLTHLARLPLIEHQRPDPSKGVATYQYWWYPTLQPGTNRVLFVLNYRNDYSLREFNLATGQFRAILDEKDGFSVLIGEPHFIGPDEIVFLGVDPKSTELRTQADAIGLNRYGLASYRLKFGEPLKRIMPTTTAQVESRFDIRSASTDGRRLLAIGLSQNEPYNDLRNIEIFTLTDGQLRQHTQMRSHLGGAVMSGDGRVAIFEARFDREGPRDVGHEFYAIDLDTDQVTHLPVLELLRRHIEQFIP